MLKITTAFLTSKLHSTNALRCTPTFIEADLDKYATMPRWSSCFNPWWRSFKDRRISWRHLGAIGKKITPGLQWTFDGAARDMVDDIAGVENIHSSVMFTPWRTFYSCGKAHARLISRFLTSKHKISKTQPGDKG